jgi:hypothetical protein
MFAAANHKRYSEKRTCFLKANVLSTPKIESPFFHLKTSIKGRMNNSTEIRPNFKDGILRTFVSSRNNTNYETNTYHYHRLCIFGAENTEKTPQLIAVTQENFVKT